MAATAVTLVAVVLQRLGRKADAKKRYERVLELAPTHSAANSNLARLDASAGSDTSGVLDYGGMSSAFDRHGEVDFDQVVRFEPGQRVLMRSAGAEEGATDDGDNAEQEWRVLRFDEEKSAHIVVRDKKAAPGKSDAEEDEQQKDKAALEGERAPIKDAAAAL